MFDLDFPGRLCGPLNAALTMRTAYAQDGLSIICIILRNIEIESIDYDTLLFCYLKVSTWAPCWLGNGQLHAKCTLTPLRCTADCQSPLAPAVRSLRRRNLLQWPERAAGRAPAKAGAAHTGRVLAATVTRLHIQPQHSLQVGDGGVLRTRHWRRRHNQLRHQPGSVCDASSASRPSKTAARSTRKMSSTI